MPNPSKNNPLFEITPLAQLDRLLTLCNDGDYEGAKLLADACTAKAPRTGIGKLRPKAPRAF
jgi:hypothetical protein